jgi:uncharacterized protein (TIGR03435 family)
MTRFCVYFAVIALSCGAAYSQPPAFELADVHPSPHSNNPVMRGGVVRSGQFELRTATMLDLIGRAWDINTANIAGGPSWIETDRFDIIAKVPADTSPEALRLMLQSLLADRFKLVVHNEDKPMAAYVLTAGKRPLLKQSEGAGPGGCEPQESDMSPVINGSFLCHHVTMAEFAQILQTWGRPPVRSYIGTNPVRDMTGLQGAWDFHIKWTGRGMLTSAGSDGITLFDAMEKQLGLKMELKQAPIPVLVVDNVNEKPTDNLPGIAQKLPPLPTEFEVADIKPSQPGTKESMQVQPGGRIDANGISMKELVQFAWDVEADDLIAAPKWMADLRFDIVAKAPKDALADSDAMTLMLRALLVDRFKLAVHTEDQPVNVYALVAVNPSAAGSKLKKADPSNRSGCRYTGGVAGTATTALLRNNVCQNVTMTQFADWLQNGRDGRNQARMYMDHPIVDETGIDGARDFTLNFSGFIALQTGPGRGGDTAANGTATASDPNGAIPLGDALEKQLALRLELRKHPMPVLVVDHAEQKPTDN